MSCYAAVVSLMHTIKSLQNTCHYILPNSILETLDSAYKQAESLKQLVILLDTNIIRIRKYRQYYFGNGNERFENGIVFESHLSNQFINSEDDDHQIIQFVKEHHESYRQRVDASNNEFIKEAVHELQHLIESLVTKFRQPSIPIEQLSKQVKQEVNSFMESFDKKRYGGEMSKEDNDAVSSRLIFDNEDGDDGGIKSKMVRLLSEFPINWDLISEVIQNGGSFVNINLDIILQRMSRNRSRSSSETLNILDGQIREAAYKLQDVLESHHLSNQFLSSHHSLLHVDLREAKQDISSFVHSVRKLKEDYINELSNLLPEEDDGAISSRISHFGGIKSKVVGLSYEVHKLKEQLTSLHPRYDSSWAFTIFGMAGIGKTTLAKELFEDPTILSHFDHRVWVAVGPKYQLKEILQGILAQVNPGIETILNVTTTLVNLRRMIYERLKDKRYLIVLDDVWNSHVYEHLNLLLPKGKKRSRVLLTTRLHEVAHSASGYDIHIKRFMNKEESWCLLCEMIFSYEPCPPQLEKVGKKIANHCEGLPLTIVMIADLLSKDQKTPEYWNKVAEKENSVFMDTYDQMSKVLYPSYNFLPQHLKACFLYMALFPENYGIPCSKLIELWTVEEFLEPIPSKTVEGYAEECLEELLSKSLILALNQSSTDKVKTYWLHSVFRPLCIKEAGKNKFFHVFNNYADRSGEGMQSQRRLFIYNNILFGIKDVYNSIASISSAHSVLCTGPYHQYPVPMCFDLRLLRILDALTIRFYEFPMEILKLVQLRYLAFTFNGNLPCSISKLWKLQFLIVRRHLSIKSSTYLPTEIWDMKNLKHIQIAGSNLREPCGDTLLPYLSILSDVSAHSCTKGVLERIPNLIKLGIRIEIAPDVDDELLSCFDHIRHLDKLESLKCVIMNPNLRSEVVAPRLSTFPSTLKKLSMNGFGYPWEDMDVIGLLPNLKVLKLRGYAFRGPTWEIKDHRFVRLEFLLLEDTDLMHWTVGFGSLYFLKRLSIKNCYKLEEIPMKSNSLKVEIIDCSPMAVACAMQINEKNRIEHGDDIHYINILSSRYHRN